MAIDTVQGWAMDTPSMFTASRGRLARQVFLVVERLADGSGWDWAAWSSAGARSCRQGCAQTALAAMVEAELAASRLCGYAVPGRPPVRACIPARERLSR